MDPHHQTSNALIDRANTDIAQLLRRFENVIAFAPISSQDTNTNPKTPPPTITTAVTAYQMEVETAALVRAAEDILSLTRTLKEAWLFGKLKTVGPSPAEGRARESARRVAEE